MKGITWIF